MGSPIYNLDPLPIGDRTVRISVFLPPDAELETNADDGFRFAFQNDERVVVARVLARPAQLLRVFFLSAPGASDLVPGRLLELLPEDYDARPIPDLATPVEAASHSAGLTVNALFAELLPENSFPPSPEDDLEAYCTMTVSSHGFPAGVLVRDGQFLLPGRSGLPMGVVGEPQYLLQNIDIEPGDDYYLHSDAPNVGELRRLHQDLVKHDLSPDFTERGLCVLRLGFE